MSLRIDTGGLPDARTARFAEQVRRALDELVSISLIEFDDVYTEPMYLGLSREPAGILLLRCRETDSPETPVGAMAAVDFVFETKGARIDALDGPVVGTRYLMTFAAVG